MLGTASPTNTVQHPRRPESSVTPLCKPQNLLKFYDYTEHAQRNRCHNASHQIISHLFSYLIFHIIEGRVKIWLYTTLILANSSIAAFAADAATLGSTTEARNATVDIMGLPALLKGMGWYARGPSAPPPAS